MSEKVGSVKAELSALELYKKKYAENPTPALERIIKRQGERIKKAVVQELEAKKGKQERIVLKPSEAMMPSEFELKPTFSYPEKPPMSGAVYELTPSKMPDVEVIEMVGEKVATKKGELGRLRKKLLADIERLKATVGLPSRSIDRMMRNAETGREATVMKLAQELQKYEMKYDEVMAKVQKSRAKRGGK